MSKSVAPPVETPRPNQQPANSQPANSPDNSGTPAGARASGTQSVPSEKRTLAEIFADDGSEGESPPNGEQPDDDPTALPDSLDAVAKRLKLTPEQLFAIKVAMPSGAEPLTLGEIKDRAARVAEVEQRELQFDQRRVKAEGDLLRGQAELRELVSMLPKGSISPEIVNKLRERHNATMTRERELTLEHIQDWQDEKRMAQEVDGIAKWLHEEYGFDPSFVTTIVDHRALKFVRDMFLRDKKIKAALAGVRNDPPRARAPSSRQQPVNGRGSSNPARPGAVASNRPPTTPTERDRLSTVLNK